MTYSDLVLDMFYQGKLTKSEAKKLIEECIYRLNFEAEILEKKLRTIDGEPEKPIPVVTTPVSQWSIPYAASDALKAPIGKS